MVLPLDVYWYHIAILYRLIVLVICFQDYISDVNNVQRLTGFCFNCEKNRWLLTAPKYG